MFNIEEKWSDNSAAGFGHIGDSKRVAILLEKTENPVETLHVAFTASSKEIVDEFYNIGISAGGTDNGAPGHRPNYGKHYYAAFVKDPDGNNIEAVYRGVIP